MHRFMLAVLIVVVLVVPATLAGAGEKENTSQKVLPTPIVGVAEFGGICRPFNSLDPRQPIPAGPEGTIYRFRVIPQVTTWAKEVKIDSLITGVERRGAYELYGENAFPEIVYTPRASEAPGISLNISMKDAHYSASDLLFGFGSKTRRQYDYWACYTPILVVPPADWARVCQEIGTPTNAEEVAASRAENQRIKAANDSARVRYEAALAKYQSDCERYKSALAEWEKLPTQKRVAGTAGTIEIRRSVIRFMEGRSLSQYSGLYSIITDGKEVASGQAHDGQATFGWWMTGAKVQVFYGPNLQLFTNQFTLEADGVIEVCWQPQRRQDATRRSIGRDYVLDILCSGRKAGADNVLRALGTSADEVESAIRSGCGEDRPVCPGEHFQLAFGQPAQVSSWTPSCEWPAYWVTLQNGTAYAVQIIRDCGNFVVGRYCPPADLLQPDICKVEGKADTWETCTRPAKPCPPTKPTPPTYLKPVPVPRLQYRLPGSPAMEGSAEVKLCAQGVDLSWLVYGLAARVAQRQSQAQWQQVIVNPEDGTVCPPDEPGNPPDPGWVFPPEPSSKAPGVLKTPGVLRRK